MFLNCAQYLHQACQYLWRVLAVEAVTPFAIALHASKTSHAMLNLDGE